METKNKTPTPTQHFKYDVLELRRTIRDMKEKKQLTDLEILRYTYRTLGYILTRYEKD